MFLWLLLGLDLSWFGWLFIILWLFCDLLWLLGNLEDFLFLLVIFFKVFFVEIVFSERKIGILVGFKESDNMKSSITLDQKGDLIGKRNKKIDCGLWGFFGK